MKTADNFLGLGKKAKEKRVAKKTTGKSGKSGLLTAAFNTYKSVTQKIGISKNNSNDEIADIPVRKRFEFQIDNVKAPERTIGRASDNLSIDEKLYTPGNIDRGLSYTRPVNHDDDPVNSEKLSKVKTEGEVIVTGKRKVYMQPLKKENNTLLYILIIAVVAFAVYQMAKK